MPVTHASVTESLHRSDGIAWRLTLVCGRWFAAGFLHGNFMQFATYYIPHRLAFISGLFAGAEGRMPAEQGVARSFGQIQVAFLK